METEKSPVKIAGNKIRDIRKVRNLTQDALAEKANINTNYLAQIERGERCSSINIYGCIADTLGVDFWQLFCDTPEDTMKILDVFGGCTKREIVAIVNCVHEIKGCIVNNRIADE